MKIDDIKQEIADDPSLADANCTGYQDVYTYLWSGYVISDVVRHAHRLGVEAEVESYKDRVLWRKSRIRIAGPAGKVLRWYQDIELYK